MSFGVVHERDAARHAGGEVAAGRAEHHDAPAGHVLAAVVADALDDRGGAGVAHAEPLAHDATEVGLAAGGAVERDVAGDDVLLGGELRLAVGEARELAAREPLAGVVVGVALEPQRDAAGHERAEALTRRPAQVDGDGVVGQAVAAATSGERGTQHGADGAVDVADRHLDLDPLGRVRARARPPRSAPGRARWSSPWSCAFVQ